MQHLVRKFEQRNCTGENADLVLEAALIMMEC